MRCSMEKPLKQHGQSQSRRQLTGCMLSIICCERKGINTVCHKGLVELESEEFLSVHFLTCVPISSIDVMVSSIAVETR